MSLTQGSLLLSHLIALTTFSALVMNRYFDWGWSLLGLAVIAASFLVTLSGKKWGRAPRFWNALSILFCLFFLIDLLWLSRDLLSAGMHFLTYLMAYRLLHLENSKDELQLYLISFLQLLAAAGDGSDFSYAVSFLFASFFMVGGLLVQHFKREQESLALSNRPLKEVIPPRFFILTPFLTLAVLAVTLLLFLLIPRIGIAFFQKKGPSLQRVSGFSEKVDFGSLGPVKLDPSSVMRVAPLGGAKEAAPPYLRGMSFDAYDGRAWQNTLGQKNNLNKGIEENFTLAAEPFGKPVRKKTILLEPIDTSVLFTTEKVLSIRGSLPFLLKDLSGTLYFPSNPIRRTEYEIISAADPLSESDQRLIQIDYSARIQNHYLSVESGELDKKIAALAREITAPYQTLYEKAGAIEHYLKSNYTYTLDVAPSSRPPLEEFLFYQKKGYCEHYASAMVLLLRSIGIASRLVTGFLPGEWNEVGKYYLIRQSDAHAWVEVYFPGERWVAFDPTTSASRDRNAFLTMTAAYLDWMRFKWDRYIVRYSLRDQFAFVQEAGDRFGDASNRFSSLFSKWKRSFFSALGRSSLPLGVLLFLFGAFLFWMKRGGRGMRKESGQREISAFYLEMLRILARKGILKRGPQTPFEFIESVRAVDAALLKEAEKITQVYCHVRFGKKNFPPEEAAQMETLLNRLRSTPQ